MEIRNAYIGLTDPDWYSFLSEQERIDEVNFWQPHGNRKFRAIKPGELFFFKLRAPYKAIVGFGFFERFEIMPAWLAWDCFNEMNGAPDFDSMIDRITRLRREDAFSARAGDFKIGCIMIAAPFFFNKSEWIDPPSDWARTGIQQGKGYSLDSGEGLRILQDCLDRVKLTNRHWNVEKKPELVAEGAERYGSPIQFRPRKGQGIFRATVREAYGHACAVTHEHSDPVLEAHHIIPYGQGGEHRVDNGILIRRDLHPLFEHGYVTVTPDYIFRVGDSLRDKYKNGRSYYSYNNSRISIPKDDRLRPSKEFLDWHVQMRFKG